MTYEINIINKKYVGSGVKICWSVTGHTEFGTIHYTNFNTLDEDFINMRLQMLAETMFG